MSRTVLLIAAATVVAAIAAGYLLGHGDQASRDEAEKAAAGAYRKEATKAERRSYAASRRRGHLRGLQLGAAQARSEGRRDGELQAQGGGQVGTSAAPPASP